MEDLPPLRKDLNPSCGNERVNPTILDKIFWNFKTKNQFAGCKAVLDI